MDNDHPPKDFPHRVGAVWVSDKRVMHTPAGWYIGTICWSVDPQVGELVEPYSRETEYFDLEEDAQRALVLGDFNVRDCPENNAAYREGLPIPKTIG